MLWLLVTVCQMRVRQTDIMNLCLLVCLHLCVVCQCEVGPGLWSIINIASCPLSADNAMQTNMTKKKLSRTQDGFTGSLQLGVDLTDQISMNGEICQMVDGGCKPFMVMKDDSFCNFMKEYMVDMFEQLLGLWGVEEKDCPVKKGVYSVQDYPFNYSRLKRESVYGTFETEAKLLDGQAEVLCLVVVASFTAEEEEQDD